MRFLNLILGFMLIITFSACAQEQATPLPKEDPLLNICEAATEPLGSRVRLTGVFDGFGYETKSLRVTMKSNMLCNENGGGLAVATLVGNTEKDKLLDSTRKCNFGG